ncbi:hypothetical protein FO488_00235 [Geobacter sp. FeAm09]|uniref:type IV secretion system DNA-binding domain-containing protein n=1 Tax=Geobacter sp. FeAm09 TaxID=2597769 RepID=UPI0011EE9C25|nr:type IV secretion system DNA-binding domain-containing protein [Geobacter sp. FeAm09]QEM66736.1 hypothetical protein FO488_00235 [Geobacter sp. FeAm09]
MARYGNDNVIDGTLSQTTRMRMRWQGFKIRLIVSLSVGIMAGAGAIFLKPPRPVPIQELGPEAHVGFIDQVQWKLAEHNVPKVQFPRILHIVADLPEQYREAGLLLVIAAVKKYWMQFMWYLGAGLSAGVITYWMMVRSSHKEMRSRTEDQYVRGSRLVSVDRLTKETRREGSRLQLAGGWVPQSHELSPWSFVGRPRIGKTVALKSLLDQVMDIGARIIFDSKGDMIVSHYRPGDLIFAPAVDQRSLTWTIFNDITSVSQIASIAAALIPEGTGNNKMWAVGAREVLEGLILHAFYKGKKTNRELWNLCCLDPERMHGILSETPGAERAAGMLANPKSNTAYSFYVSLIAFLKPIQLLAKMDGPFSVNAWLNSDPANSIFIVATPEHQEALKPVMSLFLSMMINSHLSMPDDLDRRIWYFLDELTILPKIEKLIDAINFGPSKGLICILGFQALQLLDEIYGQRNRETLWSAVGTHVMFSVGERATQMKICEAIGEMEVLEHRSTMSIGITDSRDGASAMEQLTKRVLVMPDEIKDLPKLTAYLKILGFPAAKLKFTYKPYKKVAEGLVPDPGFSIDEFIRELVALKRRAGTVEQEVSNELERTRERAAEEQQAMESGGEVSEW